MDLREHGLHPLRGRRRRRQEAHVGDALVERPVRDEAVKVDIQAEVAAEPLDRHEHARVQRRHGREAWRTFIDRRMSCVTACARLSATLARSA